MVEPVIYKISGKQAWDEALTAGAYGGSSDDRRDGFIHLSTAGQLPGTVEKHFAGRSDLVVAAFATDLFGAELKWEPSRGGKLFPHVYGTLDPSAAMWTKPLPLTADGFEFTGLCLEYAR